jgi:quaternary ammonium compound-resistance protein SugE
MMAWIILLVAGLLEIGWAVGLKFTQGFSRLTPSVLTLIAMVLSLWLLAQAARTLPIGTAYAVWTGIGAAGTAIAGMILLGESAAPVRLLAIGLIVTGLLMLRVASP